MNPKSFITASTLALVLLLTGCGSASKVGDQSKEGEQPKARVIELSKLMEQAGDSEISGSKAAALTQYEAAAKLYPTSKLPWARIAQIQFEAANYGEAIIAAQQVVARDEKDKVAHSILSVSGLRVSTKALADLGRQNELNGSVRSEAQTLARVLRESLGEKVLVPAQSMETPRAPGPSSASPTSRPPAAVRNPREPVKPAETPRRSEGNPFGALQ